MSEISLKSKIIDGILVPYIFDEEKFRSALNYKPRAKEVFLCVYPKSGTTWMQVILYALMHNGEAFDENISEYFACTPFIDQVGEEGINQMHHPYVIKTHLPFTRIPCDHNAKYVCVIRNSKDVCVSIYHFFTKSLDGELSKTTFDKMFENFIDGTGHYGDYFEHLRSVWDHKDKDNVFLVSYEEMKQDLSSVILRLCRFLNIELNEDLMKRVLTCSSFDYMKERFHKTFVARAHVELANELPTASLPVTKDYLKICDKMEKVRAGIIGGWSSVMTTEQAERLDRIFFEKTKDMHGLEKFFSTQQKSLLY